jgi:hypothetical protein
MITSNCISPPNNSADASLDVIGVNERIGVGFQPFAIQDCLWLAPQNCTCLGPSVFHALEPDIAVVTGEALGNRVLPVGVLRAIHAAPRQQAGEVA